MSSISRFVVLTVDFGAVFVVQFLLLSVCFGIPLMTFFMSTGQYLGSGLIDMWRISPIFQGVGVSLMIVQGMVGVYNIVITSWMFVYFRDSFITLFESYRWTQCEKDVHDFNVIRKCSELTPKQQQFNHSWKLEESIPDYFAATVLQRSSPEMKEGNSAGFGNLKFQVAFNLVVIWMIVFICLSKGLRSYGKVVYVFGTLPIIGFIVFATKILGLFPLLSFQDWLYDQDWSAFIYNAKSWVCAAKECFFTWSFFGGSLLQLASHNKFKHNLRRDTTIIILVTLLFLVVSGILGVAIHKLLETSGQYTYIPSSFETYESYQFLTNLEYRMKNSNVFNPASSALKSPKPAEFDHVSFLSGIRIIQPRRNPLIESGYQVNRLATELIPAYFAILGPKMISPFWSVLFYFTMIMLGIAQCLALFHTVIQGMIAIKPSGLKSWEGSITFCVCLIGFVLGLPMGTEVGIYVVYFLDYTLGCGWWVMVLYLIQLFAVFVVRGKPYGAEQIASILFPRKACCSAWLAPLLAFTWNVVLPIALLIMAVVTFKTGLVAEMFNWSINDGYVYLPSWVREIGSMMQLMPLLIVPFVGIIQSCRYFLHGPDDLFDRLEMLYRPNFNHGLSSIPRTNRQADVVLTNFSANATTPTPAPLNDPPPKYTPPPSYSTATGARIARMLRQSFRRSVRRLQNGIGGASAELRYKDNEPPPPDYATVIIETSRHSNLPGSNESTLSTNTEEVYMDPHDALGFEMTSPRSQRANLEELGAYSLDFGSLQRRSIRSNRSQLHPTGRVLALGVGNLHRADSEAVLVEAAEPINIDSASEIYSAASELSLGESALFHSENGTLRSMYGESLYVDNENERVRSSHEEAVNLNVIVVQDRGERQNRNGTNQVLTINVDTSTSVI